MQPRNREFIGEVSMYLVVLDPRKRRAPRIGDVDLLVINRGVKREIPLAVEVSMYLAVRYRYIYDAGKRLAAQAVEVPA